VYYKHRSYQATVGIRARTSRAWFETHRERRDWLIRIFWRLLGTGLLLCSGSTCLSGQQGAAAQSSGQNTSTPLTATQSTELPRQTPGEIYKDAMHPLDVVRRSLDNWSDAELGALSAGMHKAKEACDAAKPEDFSGDDLYDLARLCALGQDWSGANAAALGYIASHQEAHRAQAYALSVNALVHIDAN